MNLYPQIHNWSNILTAHRKAAKGKPDDKNLHRQWKKDMIQSYREQVTRPGI